MELIVVLVLLLILAPVVLQVVAYWMVYAKAGEPGWAALVPVYNVYVLLRIVGRPWWWLLLLVVPVVNLVVDLLVSLDLARAFRKGDGFGVGLWLLPAVFMPVLAFGQAEYGRPAAA